MTMIQRIANRRRTAPAALLTMALAGLTGCQSSVNEAKRAASTLSPLAAARLDAEQHVAAGRQDAAAGDYRGAVDEFTVALDGMRPADPNVEAAAPDADILFQRGVAWLELGFPDTAAEDFSEVLRIQRDNGAAFAKRGQAYVALGDLYRAVRDCTEAIRFEPNNVAAYRYRGLAYLGRGQFDRATIDMEQAVAFDPAIEAQLTPLLGKAYYGWSKQLASAGDPAGASEKLTRAQQLNPTYVAEATAVARPDEPTESVDPAIRTVAKPVIDEAVEHFNLGNDLQVHKRYDEAIMEFTEAIALDRKYIDAYIRRAEVLIAAGFPDTALKDVREALRIDERSADAYRLQAQAFMSLGNYHRVAMSATEALHIDPGDVRMYALRGEAYLQLGESERAIADLEEAVRRSPGLEPELKPLLDEAHAQVDL